MRALTMLLLASTVCASEVSVRSPRGGNSYAVFKGAYIGDGMVICRKSVLQQSQAKPSVYWKNHGAQASDWIVAKDTDLGLLRIQPFSGIKATPLEDVHFEDPEAMAAFVVDIQKRWGIVKRPPTMEQQYVQKTIPTSRQASVLVGTLPTRTDASTTVSKDLKALEDNLALARAEIAVLREQLTGLDSIEMGLGSVQTKTATFDSKQQQIGTAVENIRKSLDAADGRLSALEDAKFRVEVIFPDGEKYQGAVKAKDGLLRLDFSGTLATSQEE